METILFIACDEINGKMARHSLETLTAAIELAKNLGANFAAGYIGNKAETAASRISGCGATKLLAVTGPEFSIPRYATDAAAVEALAKISSATIVIAPDNSRFSRALPGVAVRLGGRVDTHLIGVAVKNGTPVASRWLYRQRIMAELSRSLRPWLITISPGCFPIFNAVTSKIIVEAVAMDLPAAATHTTFVALNALPGDVQTIQPDAQLLFVAGAGWTKKQTDGQTHAKEAGKLILNFLRKTQTSLGSSKSLINIGNEDRTVLPFLTHMHQIGQTGSSPRHPKGLATCCYGEEPHVIGWRFINERRAIDIDPNCGWAHGKADVLYVANAFTVMTKVNELLK
ncbi:Electron transfer flavoprotein alpha/beta-subunit [Desulfovibrionales bacterium]